MLKGWRDMDLRFMQQLEAIPNVYEDRVYSLLKRRAEVGAERRFGEIKGAIKNRLAHELEVIRGTNTAKLFLFWSDVIAKIRQKTYPYISGVQNCSLVSFCLGITEVNPLQTGSFFERLLSDRSVNVPVLFVEVAKGERAEVWEYLKEEEKIFTEIGENDVRSEDSAEDVAAFFEKRSYEDKDILRKAAAKIGGPIPPRTIGELADLIVYQRYAEFTDKKPTLFYQEDAVGLLVKAGLSNQEAECMRRAFVRKNETEIGFYRSVFVQTAEDAGYTSDEKRAVLSLIEKEIMFTVCRASCVAMAQYLYVDAYFQERNGCKCL